MAKLPPGFRFSPTDIELIMYYLKRKIMGKKLLFEAISELNIYKFSPWDLPDKYCYKSKDLEWYFFCPRERKYGSGARMNRATESGYWKATGKDRPVLYNEKIVGYVKTLVFHQGHAPRGQRTDWVLHEYRFEDKNLANAGISLDAYVLCKVFQKSGPGPKNGAQYGAPFKEEEWEVDDAPAEHNSSSFPSLSVLPDNRSCSIVTSMVDPGSVSHCPSNEPSAEPNLCVVSALPALPDNTSCSLFTTMIDPGNKSVRLVTESGPSSANPCSQGMSPDDIIHLLDIFTEDPAIFSAGNKNNLSLNNVERGSNVEAASFIDGNDMYSGLEDLDDYAKLDQIPFDASLTQGADYSHNPIFLQDVPFLELNDLDIPLGHPAETVEMEPVMMGNFCTHDSDVYMQQFCFGVNSSANSQQIAGQKSAPCAP